MVDLSDGGGLAVETVDLHRLSGGTLRPVASSQMVRYRAYGAFYERYWSRLFGVTSADLDLLADVIKARVQASGRASDLTGLTRAVVAARFDKGPRVNSVPAPDSKVADPIVRRWDPEAVWAVGDLAIFVVPDLDRVRGFAPWLGTILQAGGDHVLARIDGRGGPEVHALGPAGRNRTGPSPESRMAALAESDDAGSCVDEVIWRFGGVVVGRLLGAMRSDSRFVELEGSWFLRELCRRPRDQAATAAAQALFELQGPSLTLDELLARTGVAGNASAAERFGWALALEERADTFTRVSTLPQSRWALAGPPPLPLVARFAAYDPESYVVLCTPGDTLSAAVARRLWDFGLLYAALGSAGSPQKLATLQPAVPEVVAALHPTRTRAAWWHRLSPGRR